VATWITAEEVTVDLWADAPSTPATLALYLDAAQEQCEAYAPALEDGAAVPARYKLAVIAHARDTWNAGRADEAGDIGAEPFAVAVRPLSLHVRQLLRPRDPRVVFGTGTAT